MTNDSITITLKFVYTTESHDIQILKELSIDHMYDYCILRTIDLFNINNINLDIINADRNTETSPPIIRSTTSNVGDIFNNNQIFYVRFSNIPNNREEQYNTFISYKYMHRNLQYEHRFNESNYFRENIQEPLILRPSIYNSNYVHGQPNTLTRYNTPSTPRAVRDISSPINIHTPPPPPRNIHTPPPINRTNRAPYNSPPPSPPSPSIIRTARPRHYTNNNINLQPVNRIINVNTPIITKITNNSIIMNDDRFNFIKTIAAAKIIQSNWRIYKAKPFENCPVCYEDFKNMKSRYNCEHKLCKTCFDDWNTRNFTCPCCRSSLKNDELFYIDITHNTYDNSQNNSVIHNQIAQTLTNNPLNWDDNIFNNLSDNQLIEMSFAAMSDMHNN